MLKLKITFKGEFFCSYSKFVIYNRDFWTSLFWPLYNDLTLLSHFDLCQLSFNIFLQQPFLSFSRYEILDFWISFDTFLGHLLTIYHFFHSFFLAYPVFSQQPSSPAYNQGNLTAWGRLTCRVRHRAQAHSSHLIITIINLENIPQILSKQDPITPSRHCRHPQIITRAPSSDLNLYWCGQVVRSNLDINNYM